MRYKIIDIKPTESSPVEPVTLTEVKTHLHITDSENDTELTDMITRARKAIENRTHISLVVKEIVLTADLNTGELELPYGPIDEITEVKLRTGTDDSGVGIYDTLTGDEFTTDGELFKVFSSSKCGRHKITYTTLAQVEDDLKLGILEEILYRYENRGDETNKSAGVSVGICEGTKILIEPYIRYLWL